MNSARATVDTVDSAICTEDSKAMFELKAALQASQAREALMAEQLAEAKSTAARLRTTVSDLRLQLLVSKVESSTASIPTPCAARACVPDAEPLEASATATVDELAAKMNAVWHAPTDTDGYNAGNFDVDDLTSRFKRVRVDTRGAAPMCA